MLWDLFFGPEGEVSTGAGRTSWNSLLVFTLLLLLPNLSGAGMGNVHDDVHNKARRAGYLRPVGDEAGKYQSLGGLMMHRRRGGPTNGPLSRWMAEV